MTELVVERKALLESLDNDTQLLNEVIEVFLSDFPGKLIELREAVTMRDSNQIASRSHALRGSVGTFGAKTAVEAAQRLEFMARHGKVGDLDEAFSVLEREMALVASSLAQITKMP